MAPEPESQPEYVPPGQLGAGVGLGVGTGVAVGAGVGVGALPLKSEYSNRFGEPVLTPVSRPAVAEFTIAVRTVEGEAVGFVCK